MSCHHQLQMIFNSRNNPYILQSFRYREITVKKNFNYNLTLKLFSKNLHSYEICFQSAITCSKLTTETLEQGVKYVNGVNGVVLVSLLLTLNIFHTF